MSVNDRVRGLLAVWIVGASVAIGDESILKNGDFSNGLAGWKGDGAVAKLNASGIESKTGTVSVAKLELNRNRDKKLVQTVNGRRGRALLTAEVRICASPGTEFRNDRDLTGLRTTSGSSAAEEVSLVLWCGSKDDGTAGVLQKATLRGTNWVTLNVSREGDPQLVTFQILAAPGKGVVYVDDAKLTVSMADQ